MFAVIDYAEATVFHNKKRAKKFLLTLKRRGIKPTLMYVGTFEPLKAACNVIHVMHGDLVVTYRTVANIWVQA